MPKTYRIVRMFENHPPQRRRGMRGYSLEDAQAHCRDPQTSSRTRTLADPYNGRMGRWFDGYEEE